MFVCAKQAVSCSSVLWFPRFPSWWLELAPILQYVVSIDCHVCYHVPECVRASVHRSVYTDMHARYGEGVWSGEWKERALALKNAEPYNSFIIILRPCLMSLCFGGQTNYFNMTISASKIAQYHHVSCWYQKLV